MFDVPNEPIGDQPLVFVAPLPEPPTARPAAITLQTMIEAYLQEYEVRQFRINIARCRVAHLRAHFGETSAASTITTYGIRAYQVARRQQRAAPATINRETSALKRMFRIVVQWGWLDVASWDEVDLPGGVVRLAPDRSKTGLWSHSRVHTSAFLTGCLVVAL